MFQSGPQNRTIRDRGVFLNALNEKRFTAKTRIGVNGTGTARRIVKRKSTKTCNAIVPAGHIPRWSRCMAGRPTAKNPTGNLSAEQLMGDAA